MFDTERVLVMAGTMFSETRRRQHKQKLVALVVVVVDVDLESRLEVVVEKI